MAFVLQNAEEAAEPERDASEAFQVLCTFRAAEQEIAVRLQHAANPLENPPLRDRVEIDEHVAQQNQVEGWQRRPHAGQIDHSELDHLSQIVADLPTGRLLPKIRLQESRGNASRYLQIAVK